ncbi:MAG: magnesium-translocating P-type ATPase [Eubacteriaceae bacterium]|nr:magnesium-translocating P-type ATPase [Eubacteriaceae bacterium]
MSVAKNTTIEHKKTFDKTASSSQVRDRMLSAAGAGIEKLYAMLETSPDGLSETQAEASREMYGSNTVTHGKKISTLKRVADAFINPFTAILFGLVAVSAFTDIILAAPGEANPTTVVIITTMVLLSGILQFVQETKSGEAAENLLKMITTTTNVLRQGAGPQEIPLEDVVVGDIVQLAAGDMIPADMRIIGAKDLFISQSALTGESMAVEKTSQAVQVIGALTEISNLAFMGTDVVSGSAAGVVIATGNDTLFGEIAKNASDKPAQTSFEKGVNTVAWLLLRFVLVMAPVVLFVNGFTKGDWMQATLFALSVAVGLTPEMLPMIVTTCLAKGAVAMSRKKTIIKNLNSIQNLGSMNILCTDKTGTLTQDKVVLQYHLNIHGEEDTRVLRHAFLNSYYQTGLKNLMDIAIIHHTFEEQGKVEELRGLAERFVKVDEIPFDFERRRMSVVVANGKTQVITKGAVEEMLDICSYAEYEGMVLPITDKIKEYIFTKVDQLNEEGMRVIALAQKNTPNIGNSFSVSDESEMVLMGYLAFLDPPKESTAEAISALREYGVEVKVLTGDNDRVARAICRQVGLPVERILLGSDIDSMDDDELSDSAQAVSVFAKLSPMQKARIITVLRNNGYNVGYMGDGINDAAALKASDVGISVDTAVDIAKESSDVILLEKDLMVLEQGIIEGRRTYANMIKYIKTTASSNFGNMLSVLAASAFIPFIPMLPIQIILLNLIYDFSCAAIPWDNVDKEFLQVPRKWDASSVGSFMLWIGPTSSLFDITTYILMYFFICPAMCGGMLFHQLADPAMRALYISMFQAGWFVESMWSQTMVIHMIRTQKVPFVQSYASAPLTLITFAGCSILTIIPFTSFGASFGFAALPRVYFPWLALTIVLYMGLVTVFKRIFVKRHGELL